MAKGLKQKPGNRAFADKRELQVTTSGLGAGLFNIYMAGNTGLEAFSR